MHLLKFVFLFLSALSLFAQPDTEVYLMELNEDGDSLTLGPLVNISRNAGYDNQPSFQDGNTLLYASTRNGQTDIRTYDLSTGKSTWVTNTPGGSEYSPLHIPGTTEFSSIRLDTTGLQRLYRYNRSGASDLLLKDFKVGYHCWLGPDLLVTTVLIEDRMDLYLHDLKNEVHTRIDTNVGRSLLQIPGKDQFSYIKTGESNQLMRWDLQRQESDTLLEIHQVQDLIWHPSGKIILGSGSSLYGYEPGKTWQLIHHFTDKNLWNITRLAIRPGGDKLALVSDISPEITIDKQVHSFNNRSLSDFASCFAQDVVVRNFQGSVRYTGRETLQNSYAEFFDRSPSSKVEVLNRMVLGNIVIDEEKAEVDGKVSRQVAIYTVEGGRISSMTFIFPSSVDDPEPPYRIIDAQLNAYNEGNIDAFTETYSESVTLMNFPDLPTLEGRDKLKESYEPFFEAYPDLHAEITNRIEIGNVIIDYEHVTATGLEMRAIAIYEVAEGKIFRVTFIH